MARHTAHLLGGPHDGGRLRLELAGSDAPDEIILRSAGREAVYRLAAWSALYQARLIYAWCEESESAQQARERLAWCQEQQRAIEVLVAQRVCDRATNPRRNTP